jgi:DNA polymerase elongation subunit (family B)
MKTYKKGNKTYTMNTHNMPGENETIMKIKVKKTICSKSFRLIDFRVYDDILTTQKKSSDEDEKKTKEKPHMIIQMFGVNEKGETCSIFINDYTPFFYVKVSDDWTDYEARCLFRELENKAEYHSKSIINVELVDHKKLYGFTAGKEYKFAKITFKNSAAMNKIKNLWYGEKNGIRVRIPFKFKGIHLELYESNIPPLLRYFHIHNISPSGWVQINTTKAFIPETNMTSCDYEYICSITNLKPLVQKETRVPYKICSFDIEASSSHGDFPVPVKTYKRLASNILDVFNKQNPNEETKIRNLLQLIIMSAFGYDRFDDIDLVYPKENTTKEDVTKMIRVLFETPIKDAEKMNSNVTKLMTITNIFENANNFKLEENYGNLDDDEGDGDDCETRTFYKKTQKVPKINAKTTIIDVLQNTEYDRDQKLQFIDKVLIGIFPELEGDKVTFIGSTFMKYGEAEPYLNHCLVLGTCDSVDGAVIESVKTENDLLIKWTELIQQENPDIIIGYNIFGFDYEFMFRRAQENHCERDFLMLSRNKGELSATQSKQGEISIENTKVQLASGEYDLRYFKTSGRLQIDMYTYFRRDFNLSSYKLDDVAGQYISDDVKKILYLDDPEYGETTELYSGNLTGLNINDYIHIEIIGFTSDYYKDGKKFKVVNIIRNKQITEMVKGKEQTNTYNVIIIQGKHSELDEYNTKSIKWGIAKDDVTPQDIFRLSKGTSSDRAIVAKYCIQDCNLVHHLMNKIDVITGYVEMSRICSVPISFLVFRGQGIKLTSYVAKKCREKNTLMPDLDKSYENDGYEGAIVLPPKCSMYMDNPVACVDYASLYPSSMISQNYSHDSKVWMKEYDLQGKLIKEIGEKDASGNYIYDNYPGYEYIDIEFDSFKYIRKTPTSRAEKVKSGKIICRWAQLPENQKSIMPSILEELLKARSDTRKLIKTEKDPFMQNILDKRQLGYKVTANSLYGQCGAKTSTFYEKDVAASTTATGRMMITYAKRIIEEVYGDRVYETAIHGPVKCKAEYVYGDSVANYTPVYVKVNNIFDICTIEQLAEKYGNGNWVTCREEGKQEKEFCELDNVETWTESGWTKLYRVIRHNLAAHKKMIRILTHTGLVDATDDHSLLKPDGTEISPNNVKVGDELLHHNLPTCNDNSNNTENITEEEAQVMGFFFGDGSCGDYHCASGKKNSWALNNSCPYLLDKYLELCKVAYTQFDWVIMDTIESSGVYKISPRCNNKYGDIANFVRKYRSMLYYDKCKIIPNEILNGSENVRRAFWDGLYDADGDKDANGYIRIDQKNQISAANIAWLASSLGWKTSINTRKDKSNIYRITMTNKTQRKNPVAIKKLQEIEYTGFVYDLTTNNHHFAAGVGNLIVHNTDSVFFTFNLENPETGEKIRGKPALEMTIEIAQDAAQLCSAYLKPPMELSYEKTLMPFVLLSKKRYVGMLYETDANKGKLKYMGLSLKRRDSCDYLKDTYGGILNILMKENNIQKAIEYLDQSLSNLINGSVPMDKLAITKALRSDYKNPNQIAHKVLADRIGKRDPGNKPKPGDRIKFLYINNSTPKALLGERIETPEYITSQKLKIDYTYYITNQLMKPLQQLFGLAVEQIWEYQRKPNAIKTYKKDISNMENEYARDYELFMKKKEKYCSTKVKTLLFDKFLSKISNEKNRIQTITSFYR